MPPVAGSKDIGYNSNGGGIGLALGGGVALGWAHIGVLKALDRAGITVNAIAGTSIGALVGGAYLTGHLADLEAFARAVTKLRVLQFLDVQLLGPGLLGGETVVHELNKYLGDSLIEDLPKPYAAVSADIVKGEAFVSRSGSLVDAIRASISIPLLFTPVQHEGRCLVDGGIVNHLPVDVARSLTHNPVVAIDVVGDHFSRTESRGITASDSQDIFPEGAEAENQSSGLISSLTAKLFKHKASEPKMHAPNLFSTLTASYTLFVREITNAQLAISPADLHITPRVGHVSIVDFDQAEELIKAGEEIIEKKIEDIRDLASGTCVVGND